MRLPNSLLCLQDPHLRTYFPVHLVSQLGSIIQWVAISWFIYRLTNSVEMTGVSRFVRQFPILMLGSVAGLLADRFRQRSIILCSQGILFVQASALAFLGGLRILQPWQLLVGCGISGVVNAFQMPALQSWMWGLAPRFAASTVTVTSVVGHVALIIGPAIGGALVAFTGESWCFTLSAVSALPLLIIVYRTPNDNRVVKPNVRTEDYGAIALVRKNPIIISFLSVVIASSIFGLPYTTLLTIMASEKFGGGAGVLGLLLSTAGCGALAGSIVVLAQPEPRRAELQAIRGATLLGMSLLGLAHAQSVFVAQCFLALVGYGYITQTINSQKFIRRVTPEHLRGRMLGLYSSLFFTESVGALGAGWLAARTSVSTALVTGSLSLLAVCAVVGGLFWNNAFDSSSVRNEMAGEAQIIEKS